MSAPSNRNKFKFVLKRLTKFYVNYWTVFIIFVPAYILLTDKTPSSVYGDGKWWKIILEFLGFSSAYNPHWWFNRIILIYYVVFPFIFPIVKKIPIVSFIASVFIYKISEIPYDIKDWFCIFVLGMSFFSVEKKLQLRLDLNSKKHKGYYALFILFVLLLGFIQYCSPVLPYIKGRRAFVIIVFGLIGVYILIKDYIPIIRTSLSFLGRHSANIYFSHLFLYGYGVFGLTFLNNPLTMFIYVTFISLVFSLCLEKFKTCMGISKLSNIITI